MRIEIRGARVLDPASKRDKEGSIFIAEGKIAALDNAPDGFKVDETIDARGLTAVPVGQQLDKDARKVVEKAVWGMLPKNKLGRQTLKKLKVYNGPTHPHQAQQAKPFEITQVSQ